MLAWLAYLTVALVWGSTYFAISLGVSAFTPYGIVATRFTLAAPIALLLGRLRGEPWPTRRELIPLAVVGALLLGCSNPLVSLAELTLPSGIAAVLASLMPLWLALLSARHEPLHPKGWIGLALGVGGVALLAWPTQMGQLHPLGLSAMLLAPLIWAWGTLLGKRHIQGGGLFTHVGLQMATAALLGWIAAPLTGGFLRAPLTLRAALAVTYLALVGSVVAYSAFIYLAKTWPPARTGTYAYLNPLVAVLLGILAGHEPFGWRGAAGMLIILSAVALVQLRPGLPPPAPATEAP
jgi:drug/metabolite transporter (DMT)-like permease